MQSGNAGSAVRCRRGIAASEFGVLFPAFLLAAIGVVEIGWQMTVAAALDRATLRAGRFGMTGQAAPAGAPAGMSCRSQSIPWLISNSTGGVLRPERLSVTLGAAASAARLGEPPVPGPGLGGEVVTYTVTYAQPFLSGAWLALVGAPEEIVHRASLVVKNEAFDDASC